MSDQELWDEFSQRLDDLGRLDPRIRGSRDEIVGRVAECLRGRGDRTLGLQALQRLSVDCMTPLLPELVALALSHKYCLRVRQLMGRMSHRDASWLVPPVVRDLLATDEDDPYLYDSYRRLAELLDHLGLSDALADLVARAAASDDPDIREVAEDFGPGRE